MSSFIHIANCEVKLNETLSMARSTPHQKRGKRKASDDVLAKQQQEPTPEVLHHYCIAVCGTQVGAQDAGGVVHFSCARQ